MMRNQGILKQWLRRSGRHLSILLFAFTLLSLHISDSPIAIFIELLCPSPCSSLILPETLQMARGLLIVTERVAVLLAGLAPMELLNLRVQSIEMQSSIVVCMLLIIYLHHFFYN